MIRIAFATAAHPPHLPEIERRAARLFPAEVLDPDAANDAFSIPTFELAQREGRRIVAIDRDDRAVGFALLEHLAGQAHLEEIDVDPAYGRRGVGTRLLRACFGWAVHAGHESITLSTFRDITWNAPFYARFGFVALAPSELSPELSQRRDREAAEGLDPALRVMMRRRLVDSDLEALPRI